MKKNLILFFAVMQITVFSQSTNLNGWMKNGNVVSGNTNKFGSINDRSVYLMANNNIIGYLDSAYMGLVLYNETMNYAKLPNCSFCGAGSILMDIDGSQDVRWGNALTDGSNVSIDYIGRKLFTANHSIIDYSDDDYLYFGNINTPTLRSSYSYTNNSFGIGTGTINPLAKLHITPSSTLLPQLFLQGSDKVPTTLKSGMIYNDSVTDGIVFNLATKALSVTPYGVTFKNDTHKFIFLPVNDASYGGVWAGTSTNSPLLMGANFNGGNTPVISISPQTTGAVESVIINPSAGSYTGTSTLRVNNGGGTNILEIGTGAGTNFLKTNSSGTTSILHLSGLNASATTATLGTGGGSTTGGTFTLAANCSDLAGTITITTGTLNAANAVIATISFKTNYTTNIPHIVFSPLNSATANLAVGGQVFITPALTNFTFNSSTTIIPANTVLKYSWHVIQ